MSKTGHIKNNAPVWKFDDHALVIDARDFGELYFFLSSLDNVLNPFYLPAIPCHEEAFRERSTEAAGERSRGSGLTGPESRANSQGRARGVTRDQNSGALPGKRPSRPRHMLSPREGLRHPAHVPPAPHYDGARSIADTETAARAPKLRSAGQRIRNAARGAP